MSIVDDRGYNQGFKQTATVKLRNQRRVNMMLTAIKRTLASEPDRRIDMLEIGCGTGEYAHLYAHDAQVDVTATDICAPFIDYANQHYAGPRLRFAQMDMTDFTAVTTQYPAATFDAIVGNGILHHMYYELDRVLPTLWHILKPGGAFVFMEPNRYNPYIAAIFTIKALRHIAKLEPGEMAFTPTEITVQLERARFVDVDVAYRDFLVPVVPSALTGAVVRLGDVLERVPGVRRLTQSLLIVARKPTMKALGNGYAV